MATSVLPEQCTDDSSVHDAIARRAREIWQERGCIDGYAEQDWAQAEAEIRNRLTTKVASRRIVVKAGNCTYTAEYDAGTVSYHPGDFRQGQPIRLHFEGEKMWIRLPGGRDLETRIIRKD